MAARVLLVLLVLLGASLGVYLLHATDDDASGSSAPEPAREPSDDAPATPDARLEGAPAPPEPDPFVGADVTTALDAFRAQPPNVPAGAVARLGEIVDADPDLLEHLIDVAIGLEPLREDLLPPDYPYASPHQVTAMWALQALGTRAARAIAARLEKEEAPTFRDRLLDELRSLGAHAAPAAAALVACMRDDTLPDRTRQNAIDVLGAIGAPARDAVPDLVSFLRDPEHPLFPWALANLYRVGGNEPRVMDAYRELLASDDPWVLRDTVDVVEEQMGADVEALRTALERLLEFDQPEVRTGALLALAPIGVHEPGVIRLVGLQVEDGDADEERAARALLAASGEAGRSQLLDVARRTDYLGVAVNCCRTLAAAGVPLASHPEILQRLLSEAEGPALSGLVALLATLDPPPRAQDLLPVLRAELGDSRSLRRPYLVFVLPTLRGDDAAVLALLEKLLDDEALGSMALAAIGRMAHTAARAVPLLLTRLDDTPLEVIEALGMLAAHDAGARKALQAIAETHASEEVRQDAVLTLERLQKEE